MLLDISTINIYQTNHTRIVNLCSKQLETMNKMQSFLLTV